EATYRHGAAKGAAVIVRQTEVAVPRVRVRVEVDETQPSVPSREDAEHGQRHRVIAAHAHGDGPRLDGRLQRLLDGSEGGLDRDGDGIDVPTVRHPQAVEGMDLEGGVPGADQGGLIVEVPRDVV